MKILRVLQLRINRVTLELEKLRKESNGDQELNREFEKTSDKQAELLEMLENIMSDDGQ
ncbi:MAG: hypothetical protein R3C03_18735 [Pirellulaceae bacterium]